MVRLVLFRLKKEEAAELEAAELETAAGEPTEDVLCWRDAAAARETPRAERRGVESETRRKVE